MDIDNLDILAEIALGEDSSRQFKVQLTKDQDLAKELCAFSNSKGGIIYIGVADDGTIKGLTDEQLRTYNKTIANVSNENIKPAIYTLTKAVSIDNKKILLIQVPKGASKPYCTTDGVYYVKSGSDKRKASPQELLRLFQESNMLFVDETPTEALLNETEKGNGINLAKFYNYYEKSRGTEFLQSGIELTKALQNLNLAEEGKFNLAGLLLFSNNPQFYKPYCIIRCVSYYGNAISDDSFKDKADGIGTLDEQFKTAINFLKNNLRFMQAEAGGFNQTGSLEISEKALEEAIVNSLLHRDYSKNAVIRLFVFNDRVELISPGSLPNHLTVEHILNGNSVIRNPIIVSHATKILPYTGIGSGIPRIIQNHTATTFKDDKDGEQFTIVLQRPMQD